jgi:hypothetical protein
MGTGGALNTPLEKGPEGLTRARSIEKDMRSRDLRRSIERQ